MDELKKIDLLLERLGISYKEARDALEEAEGDVVQALVDLERYTAIGMKIGGKGREIMAYIKEIIKQGNVTKVRLKNRRKLFWKYRYCWFFKFGRYVLSPLLALLGWRGSAAVIKIILWKWNVLMAGVENIILIF